MDKDERKLLFGSLLQNLEMVSQQLSDDVERRHVNPFLKDEFWKKIGDCGRQLSHESTKLCLSFSKPPFPNAESCEPLCRSMEMACLALLSAFYGLPREQGLTLRKQLRKTIQSILQALCGLITDIRDMRRGSEKEQLKATGSIWETCERLEKVPKDNKGAALSFISLNTDLVKDALQELEDAVKESLNEEDNEEDRNEDDDDDVEGSWKSSERDVVQAALGLVKTALKCMEKTREIIFKKGSDTEFQNEFDNMVTVGEAVSPAIDDFVAALYPPMRTRIVMENATIIAEHLHALLETVKKSHCYVDSDSKWWEFLFKAIDHNATKVENLTGKSRLG